jgi:uncharacterized protein (TIGR02328 family)
MRLWHQNLIPLLPRQQLLGQHRECCALRGNGWGKPHATVNYVFNHHPSYLIAYHHLVMNEMKRRGYIPDKQWYLTYYRGKNCDGWIHTCHTAVKVMVECGYHLYPEHDETYLNECIENLKRKGIELDVKL